MFAVGPSPQGLVLSSLCARVCVQGRLDPEGDAEDWRRRRRRWPEIGRVEGRAAAGGMPGGGERRRVGELLRGWFLSLIKLKPTSFLLPSICAMGVQFLGSSCEDCCSENSQMWCFWVHPGDWAVSDDKISVFECQI